MIEVVRQGYFTGILYHDVKMAEIRYTFYIKLKTHPEAKEIFKQNYIFFLQSPDFFSSTISLFKWEE